MKKLILAIVTWAITILSVAASPTVSAEPEFCWRDSQTRGVGKVPHACPEGREMIGLLCYSKCPDGMKRFGFDCHSVCPDGMRDDGLFCRAAEYGRGVGYPWKFGDHVFRLDGARARCEAEHGRDGCEKNGAIIYPKCRPGYHAFGCCICRPAVPDCNALGLNAGIDLSCAKRIRIGDPRPGSCGSDQDYDAGLCYKKCAPGYKGVGPVCWGKAPSGWVGCGMGAAKDSKTCGSAIFNQVYSVGNLAFTVATLGMSTAATGAEKAGESAEKLSKLRKLYDQLKTAYESNKAAIQTALKAKKTGGVALTLDEFKSSDNVTAEDITRVSAQIAAIADPSGASDTVAAYTYPKCSKYFEGEQK